MRSIPLLILCASVASGVPISQYGAVGDGVTDDTQAFRNAAYSHQQIEVPWTPAGYNLASGSISVPGGTHFVGQGNPVLHSAASPCFYMIGQGDWSGVKGFSISGPADAFWLGDRASKVRITDIDVSNGNAVLQTTPNHVGFIYLTNIQNWNPANISFKFIGTDGYIYIDRCSSAAYHAGVVGLYCLNSAGIFVNEFNVLQNGNLGVGGPFVMQFYNCFTVYLNRCLVDGVAGGGLLLSNCFNVISNNFEVWGCGGTPFTAIIGDKLSFSDLTCNGSPSSNGITLDGITNSRFSNVSAQGNAVYGLDIIASSYNSFSNVMARLNGAGSLAQDGSSSNNLVTGLQQ